MAMAEFKLLPIPAEDYDALGITPETVLETYFTDDGALIVRAVKVDDLNNLVCGSDCECCPMAKSGNNQNNHDTKNGGTI